MFKRIFKSAVVVAIVAMATSAAQAATIRIAQNDGTGFFNAAAYTNGVGTISDANYIANNLASYGSDATILVTVGDFTDYYRPVAGNSLLDMLTSDSLHTWSATETGPFVVPTYFSGHLGGSNGSFPTDGRVFLSFWGSTVETGGCCQLSLTQGLTWGLAFTVDLIVADPAPVPLPAGAWLLISGLGLTVAVRSQRRRA